MTIKEKVYWQDTTYPSANEYSAQLPPKADMVIIGSGIPGLSAARQLAKRGANVVVLEAETIGWGASSRNGGMALTGLKLDVAQAEARYGGELTHRMFEDSIASLDTVEQIIRQEQIECGFARKGHLLVANKPAHFVAMQKDAEWLQKHYHHATKIIPRNELHSEISSDVYYGGQVDDASAGLNPAQYVAGLALAVANAGGKLFQNARVLQIEKAPTGFRLKTQRGEMMTDQVLVATGGYTQMATPELQKRIIPIGSYIIATEPIRDELAQELIPRQRMVFDYKHFLNYYRLSADHRLIFGGRAAFFPETNSSIRNSAEILRREMVHVFPQLKDVKVEYAWGGTLDFALDQMPHAGQLNGIYYLMGFAGHGVALGTHLGMEMADAIVDGKVADLPYAAYPFPIVPPGLSGRRTWLLPLVGMWHKILDWIS